MTEPNEVGIKAAAAALGVSERTLKRYVKPGGKIPETAKRKDAAGHWLIRLDRIPRKSLNPRPAAHPEPSEMRFLRERLEAADERERQLLAVIAYLTRDKS